MNITLMYILKYTDGFRRKAFLTIGIILNLTPLILIKDYFKFITIEPNYFIQIIGISYFVLNSISMLVDYYEKKFEEFNPLDIFVYSIYFPKIFAGPLVRFKEFITELNSAYSNKNIIDLNTGLFLISLGIIKKWLADYIFQFANAVFSNPTGFSGAELFITIYIYTAFIFLDFSGYTDIARGTSLLMGIKLPENFRSPYLSTNFREFWRRWHITLYEWIKDYIYIKLLGGSRKGKIRTYINVIISFILSGMWHGNFFNYIIWGFFHGLGVIFSRLFELDTKIKKFIGWFITFNTVALLWIVFAITDITKLQEYFQHMLTDFNLKALYIFTMAKWDLMLVLFIGYIIAFIDIFLKERVYLIERKDLFLLLNFLIYTVAIILLNYKVSVSPFLYESF
jgi:D-alanyl-lipoteichoic acid acyltransferase DltB (MBOAT superfamily)